MDRSRGRRAPLSRRGAAVAAAAVLAVAGCSARAGQTAEPVTFDLEREAVRLTALAEPLRVVFAWRMVDADARFSGDGVARMAPGYLARLDLFGPRGEGYLSAALVDEELRIPESADPDAVLPPPALVWSTVGVFRPPDGAELVVTRKEGDRIRLEYQLGRERWRFTIEGGRLVRAELDARDGRHTVELRGEAPFRLPRQAVYRDWAAFRELVMTLDEAERTAGFPPGLWTLDAH